MTLRTRTAFDADRDEDARAALVGTCADCGVHIAPNYERCARCSDAYATVRPEHDVTWDGTYVQS